MKSLFLFIEIGEVIVKKIEIPHDQLPCLANFVANLVKDYPDAKFYVGSLA